MSRGNFCLKALSFLLFASLLFSFVGDRSAYGQAATHLDFTYANRGGLLGDGWDFLARTAAGGNRDTEQTAGVVVSYDQSTHPGAIRIPADQGTLWGGGNSTRNTLFRDLPSDWTTMRLGIAAFSPTAPYQGACLSAYQDDDNYVILCRDNTGSNVVEWWQETGGSAAVVSSLPNSATEEVWLRLDRDVPTNSLTAFLSLTAGETWAQLPGSVVKELSDPRLGIIVGGNTGATFPAADLTFVEVGTQSMPLPPSLSVSPSTLNFGGIATGANPAGQTVSITNSEPSSGVLNWTAGDDQAWLSVSPGSGTAPSSLAVNVNTAGLAAGTYTGTVTVNAPGASSSPRTIGVTLTLTAPVLPVLTVSPVTLSFLGTIGETNPASQLLSITNTEVGSGELNWTATDNQPWLSVSPGNGTAPSTVSVSVNTAGLTAGTYTGTITVNAPGASGSPKTVAVTFIVRAAYTPYVGLTYGSRTALLADGWWDFLARTADGGVRDTEQTTGLVVSYDQAAHPGVIRIPADQGTFWGAGNSTRNTLFRDLPSDWTTIRLQVAAFAPNAPYQGACLSAYQDDDNYVILCRDHVGSQIVEWWQETAGSASVISSLPNSAATDVQLRLDRNPATDTITAFVSLTGGVTWAQLPGSVVKALTNPRLGIVVGGNTSTTSFPAADLAFVDIGSESAPLPPTLGISPSTISFSGVAGGVNPAAQAVSITNTEANSGTLNWTATADQPWLTVNPGSGAAPSSMSLSVNIAGLAAGTYTGTVTVNAPAATGSPQTVAVTLIITAPSTPHTDLTYGSRTTLLADGWDFLARTAVGGVRDTEQTTGQVVSYDQGVHPGVVRIPADQGTLWETNNNTRNSLFRNLPSDWTTIRLQVAAFAPNTPYQGACLSAYQDDDNYVILCRDHTGSNVMEWWQETTGSAAVVSSLPNSATTDVQLRLDRNPATDTITAFVSLTGGVTWAQLPGSVVKALTNPRLGIVVGGNTSTTSFPAADLAFVDIGSVSTPLPPGLGVNPNSLNFSGTAGGANPAAQTVSIANTGGGTLTWTAGDNQPWLSVSSSSGTAPSLLSVNVNLAGLAAGTYNGTVTVSAPGATGSPQTVAVTLIVAAPPTPHTDFTYGSRAALSADGWDFLARTAVGGVRDTEQTTGQVVSYDQGVHLGAIRIPADQGSLWGGANDTRNTLFHDLPSDWTTIRLQVAAFTPNTLYQGACLSAYQNDDNYVILCRDYIGSNVVEWWQETTGNPVAISNVHSGSITNVRLRLDRNPATNLLTAFVSVDGGANWSQLPGSVVKTLTNPRLGIVVGGNTSSTNFPAADLAFVEVGTESTPLPPALGVSPASLTFTGIATGANPASQSVSITNLEPAGGTLNWSASDNQTWLSVSPGSGTAPSSLTVNVNTAGLAAGTYTGTVTVSAPGASSSPKTIGVTLVLSAPVPPELSVNPLSLSFSGVAGGTNPSSRTLSITNTGGGALNWSASDNQTWLSVSPGSGTAPSSLTVSVNTAGLAAGTYSGTITVNAAGAGNSPQSISVSLTVVSLSNAGILTTAVLVNATNSQGYNPNTLSPGEFQRYPERYLEHLQIPYEVINVATTAPPADLSNRHLVIAGHQGLNLSAAWRSAIVSAVNGGTGFVNLDWDPHIGSQSHIQTIFGATGSSVGGPGSTVVVPADVIPGGSAPHFIAAMQQRFLGDPAGDLVYDFHEDESQILQTVQSTLLTASPATVIAKIQDDPLISVTSYGSGRAVHFGTTDYLKADRFGFLQGVDDLFWRSLVWAAKKPFVVRGYPRLWSLRMDDTQPGWATRVQDLYNLTLTGNVNVDGTGGPWKVTGYTYTSTGLPPGTPERASAIVDINANRLQVSPHNFGSNASCGDIYWNSFTGPFTDAQWLTNLNAISAWQLGTGGADAIPSFSRSMIPHCWDLGNNTGFDLWNVLGFRYVTEIQKPGFQVTFNDPVDVNNGQERISARPFWVYEKPPKLTRDENYPFFFADDYLVGSRQGLPSQTLFLFETEFHRPGELRPDVMWPEAVPGWTVGQSVDQFQRHTWRFWSSLAPMAIFTHDASNYELSSITERRAVIQQLSPWLSNEKGRHVFMGELGDYIYARTKSTLASVLLSAGNLTLTFSGNAATADSALVPTDVKVYLGDDEGTDRTISGFIGGANVTIPVITP